MANSENVTPYGELVHQAAEAGGPEAWISQIEDGSKKEGMLIGAAVAVPAGILVWEGLKKGYRYIRTNRRLIKKKVELAKDKLTRFLRKPEEPAVIDNEVN